MQINRYIKIALHLEKKKIIWKNEVTVHYLLMFSKSFTSSNIFQSLFFLPKLKQYAKHFQALYKVASVKLQHPNERYVDIQGMFIPPESTGVGNITLMQKTDCFMRKCMLSAATSPSLFHTQLLISKPERSEAFYHITGKGPECPILLNDNCK